METSKRRIGLVSCVKSKRPEPAAAADLYTSALFEKSRAWVEGNCDGWFILSARYGLLAPDARVDPYEQTLKEMSAGERRAWANRVLAQMREVGLLTGGTTFVWLAGMPYKRDLAELLSAYDQEDPMQGLPIGKRLQWLTEHAPGAQGG
jgi:hypothetical protein